MFSEVQTGESLGAYKPSVHEWPHLGQILAISLSFLAFAIRSSMYSSTSVITNGGWCQQYIIRGFAGGLQNQETSVSIRFLEQIGVFQAYFTLFDRLFSAIGSTVSSWDSE
jgi:hypothetical protein